MQPKHQKCDWNLTRKQLTAYGLSEYHAIILTKELEPIEKSGNANVYSCREIIASAYNYIKKPNLKADSQESIKKLIETLQQMLGNKVEIHFEESSNKDIQKAAAKLINAMSETDKSLARLKADRLEILHKYNQEI